MEISQEVLSAIIGGIVAFLASFMLLHWQLRESRKLARVQLFLEFDNRLNIYDKIHRALRPGGNWKISDSEPPQGIEWYEVDSYMGTFERLEHFIVSGIVDKETAKTFYRYRIQNLVAHKAIREKLIDDSENWERFRKLCKILDVNLH